MFKPPTPPVKKTPWCPESTPLSHLPPPSPTFSNVNMQSNPTFVFCSERFIFVKYLSEHFFNVYKNLLETHFSSIAIVPHSPLPLDPWVKWEFMSGRYLIIYYVDTKFSILIQRASNVQYVPGYFVHMLYDNIVVFIRHSWWYRSQKSSAIPSRDKYDLAQSQV